MNIRSLFTLKLFLILNLLIICIPAAWAEHKQLKAFPPANNGKERVVIMLPHKEGGKEDSFKVELIPGKTMLTDGTNLMRLGMTIEPRPLKGWGYTYYEVTGGDIAMSTLMASPEGKQKIEQFVSGTPLLIRYNSRLPIVIYLNKGIEIRYRIWKASDVIEKAEEG